EGVIPGPSAHCHAWLPRKDYAAGWCAPSNGTGDVYTYAMLRLCRWRPLKRRPRTRRCFSGMPRAQERGDERRGRARLSRDRDTSGCGPRLKNDGTAGLTARERRCKPNHIFPGGRHCLGANFRSHVMTAGEQRGRGRSPRREQMTEHAPAARPRAPAKRRRVARVDRPAVAPCVELDRLRVLAPEEARWHVHGYLHDVMLAHEADDFEALRYCWELHLVELEQLCLIRSVELSKRKLGHYRAVLRKGGGFPPLI